MTTLSIPELRALRADLERRRRENLEPKPVADGLRHARAYLAQLNHAPIINRLDRVDAGRCYDCQSFTLERVLYQVHLLCHQCAIARARTHQRLNPPPEETSGQTA